MSLSLPSASVTVRKAGLGVAKGGPTNVHVCIGPSSKGPLNQPIAYSRPNDAAGTFGTGPMPKAAAFATRSTSARYIVVRIPTVAVTPFVSAITKPTGKTVAVAAPIGVVPWGHDVSVVITTAGAVGTAGIFYKKSLDGGVTYTAPIALGTATSITVGTKSITLTAAETYAVNDEIKFYTLPGSQAIKDPTVTRVGSSTSTLTLTGTPEDEYEIVVEYLFGGTVGTTGITFRYSLDGGEKWSPATQLGTATTFMLMDGTEESGVTLNLAAGTIDKGDKLTSATTGPAWQASDVQAALDTLRASSHAWRFVHVAGDATAAKVASVGGRLTALEGLGVFTYAIFSARDRTDGEVDGEGLPSVYWGERLISEYASLDADRVGVSAGRARVTCPITGRANRRPASWIAVQRLIEKTIQVDPGRKLDGALPADVRIYDSTGRLVELDSRVRDSLHGARFTTLRTFDREPGVYVTRGNSMAAEGSEFNRIARRAVMDLASEVYLAIMTIQIENHLRANPLTGAQPGQTSGETVTPGALAEVDARIIDRELVSGLTDAIVKPGYASAVRARVSRTDPFYTTGLVTAEVSVTGLAYVDKFNGGIGYENPQFAALLGS